MVPSLLCATASCNRPDPNATNATGSPTEGGSGGATCEDDDHDHFPVGLAVALSMLGTALVGGIGVYCYMRSRASTIKSVWFRCVAPTSLDSLYQL